MKLDTRLTSSALTLALAAVVIPFTADWQLPLLNGVVVRWIENGQALWLLFGALFTAWYIRPLSRPEGAKQFWLWAVVWWVVLLGRSTSWGRDYFPNEPRMLFRTISVILIAALVLPVLFSAGLRKGDCSSPTGRSSAIVAVYRDGMFISDFRHCRASSVVVADIPA